MEKERALEYWINRYNDAKDYNDIHWDADERHEHRDYVLAMAWAIKAIEQYTDAPPIRRGRWIAQPNGHVSCSSCGKEQAFASDFCKHCGADMRDVPDMK